MMTDKEKEHYEKLANYYNSKTKTYNEIFGEETKKYKVIVEYEYPCDHKPPVKADIYLHGDKVTTREIKPLQTELEKIKADLQKMVDDEWNQSVCADKGLELAIEVIEDRIAELKGE